MKEDFSTDNLTQRASIYLLEYGMALLAPYHDMIDWVNLCDEIDPLSSFLCIPKIRYIIDIKSV